MILNNTKSIPRAKNAESVGVDSSVVHKMTEEMALIGINLHSLMILRNGEVACEGWSKPLTPDTPHMVYSVSKSFLATAYGFALDEGLITRGTRFVDVFPEYRNKKDKNLEKLTIHHLLTMTAGKQTAIRGEKTNKWIETFVKAKWIFTPGEGWRYVNDNYYIASAMLVRVLGVSITEYLTDRLYKPLGIDVPFWETAPGNVEAGGWGLMLKTEDIAKLILCYHNNGVYDGVQVIPEAWVKEATTQLHDNSTVEKHRDSQAGYGCGFWKCAGVENAFRCEGVFCQYAISLKDYDACIIMTSDHSDLQETLDVIWKYVPDMFIESYDTNNTIPVTLPDDTSVTVNPRSEIESKITGNTYKIRRCKFANMIGFPVSVFPMPVIFFAQERGGNMDNISFEFNDEGLYLSWTEDGGHENKLQINMDGTASDGYVRIGELNLNVRSHAFWENNNTLVVKIRPLVAVAQRVLKFEFMGNKIRMYPSTIPSTEEKAKKIGEKLKCILIGRWFHWWIDFLVPRVGKILNPTHRGKIKKQ